MLPLLLPLLLLPLLLLPLLLLLLPLLLPLLLLLLPPLLLLLLLLMVWHGLCTNMCLRMCRVLGAALRVQALVEYLLRVAPPRPAPGARLLCKIAILCQVLN
jgi:hypothetical protein